MITIRLKGKLTEDRHLIVDIPDEVPSGEIQLVLELPEASPAANEATLRARAKLAAAGALSTVWKAPRDMMPPEEDEIIELSPGSLSIDEIISQDRDERE